MEGDQEMRHMCKFCDKIFPCGRSLGGHMRSHLIKQTESSSDKLGKKKLSSFCNSDNVTAAQNGYYSLREKPKKTSKFSNSSGDFSLDHLEATAPIRKQRSRNNKRRYTTTNAATITNDSSPCVSEIEQEQEEAALSLILLSRDVTVNWCGKKSKVDSFSPISISRNGIETEQTISEANDQIIKEGTEMLLQTTESSELEEIKKQKSNKRDWNLMDSSFSFVGIEKKNKFSCNSCNKIFHSYQALGGHRATYKKMKGCFGENSITETEVISLSLSSNQTAESKFTTPDEKIKTLDYMSKKNAEKVHECSICFKIFLSGQALGGHKRTHLSKIENKKSPEIRDFLDLNLAAATPEHELVVDNNISQVYCKSPWWIGNNHMQRQLVGLFL